MKRKKTLGAGVSILIVTVLVITAFIRGNAQAWLLAIAFGVWTTWAVIRFMIPYIKEQRRIKKAKEIRKQCEEQDAASRKFEMPVITNPIHLVLLRHVNYRISAYIQSIHPEATWEWREEFPELIVSKGGTGRIRLFGVKNFNYADITFDQYANIVCDLLNVVPIAQSKPDATKPVPTESAEPVVAPAPTNPVDPRIWYEMQGCKVLESIINDLNSRGYSNLTILENGDIVVQQGNSKKVESTLESLPERTYWSRLCKIFEGDGIAATIKDDGLLLAW